MSEPGQFNRSLACFVEPALADLDARLGGIAGIGRDERAVLHAAAEPAFALTAHRKAARTLLLELNAARVTGRLTAQDPAARFAEFLESSADPAFWQSLGAHYPTLSARLRTVLDRRCAAVASMAGRLARDRARLVTLVGGAAGPLTDARFGLGDSHRGGHTVAILTFGDGSRVVYKPRSVLVDAALDRMLGEVFGDADPHRRIRVPAVVAGREQTGERAEYAEYGWAEHVQHRYCVDEAELAAFYHGIGHWLAVMRLLGGSDLHAENVIACGPVPVAASVPATPADPHVIAAEVDDLLHDDIPYFGTTPRSGVLTGPGGVVVWPRQRDLAAEALKQWRAAGLDLDRAVIRAALVSAYLNDDLPIHRERMERGSGSAGPPSAGSGGVAERRADLERRRRALAADLLRRLRDAAVRGEDGTATWIAPALEQTGWAVRPLGPTSTAA